MRNFKLRLFLRIVIFCLLISFCEKKVEVVNFTLTPKINPDLLDQNLLVNSRWTSNPYFSGYGLDISFRKDFTYHIFFTGEGCDSRGHWRGEYKILSSTEVLLKRGESVDGCFSWDTGIDGDVRCIYKKEKEPVLIQYNLHCGGDAVGYANLGTRIPYGQERIFRGNLVISLSGKGGFTIDNVRFRAKPDVTARIYNCTKKNETEHVSFLSDQTPIYLLFRTKEKFKVGKWENYWYYVYAEMGWYDRCNAPRNQGWVSGEFLRIISDEGYQK